MRSRADQSPPRPVVVVGNPEHKRVALFQAALARLGRPPADVLAWQDLLTGRGSLEEIVRPGALVRIESPGQNFEVEKLLLAEGAAVAEDEDGDPSFIERDEALRLSFEPGRILHPRQGYRGFRAALSRLAGQLAAIPGARWMNPPHDIALMFDKRSCQRRFAGAGIPVPAGLGPVGSFAELADRMRATGRRRVFVKLAHGSSASGVVAYAASGVRQQAITSVELVRRAGRWLLYNSRRIRRYESAAEITALFDALCREVVQVEQWIPKAGVQGHACDLRVMVVAGQVRQSVVRLSRTPMTNLHLLNRRGDLAALRARVPPEAWAAAMQSCTRAAGRFPASGYAGVDLLFAPGFRCHAVLEINAFGDLLPGVLSDGMDTYTAELAALAPG